jgi:hypothetical protein
MSDKLIYSERAPQPARSKPAPPTIPSRATWLDFFLILFGCALSLILTDLSGFRSFASENTPTWVINLQPHSLAYSLFLPVGVLLLWPLFYLTQRIAGRKQALTLGEWLWFVAWLGAIGLTVWIVWQYLGTPPDFLKPETFKGRAFVGYAVTMLALAVVALATGLVDLFGRWGRPWTHHFALALFMWPVVPLLLLLAWKMEMK